MPICLLYVIRIKIYAEYREMLPGLRLVCQEHGLRPISRSPGILYKSSRGLGSMFRYSAQILICLIANSFQFPKSPVGGMGALQYWDGHVAFHHCYCDQNEAPANDNEISQHPLLWGQALGFCWEDHTGRIFKELAKSTDKMYYHVAIVNPGIKWKESLLYLIWE